MRRCSPTVELVAANARPLAGFEEWETRAVPPLVVIYNKRPVRPPAVALGAVVPLLGPGAGVPIPVGGGPVVVHGPRVRIEGTIEAEEVLERADWVEVGGAARAVGAFRPGQRGLKVAEEFTLEPGPRTFRLRSRAGLKLLFQRRFALGGIFGIAPRASIARRTRSASKVRSAMTRAPSGMASIRVSPTRRSAVFPPEKWNAMGLQPWFAVAWTFVVRSPRERPMACARSPLSRPTC